MKSFILALFLSIIFTVTMAKGGGGGGGHASSGGHSSVSSHSVSESSSHSVMASHTEEGYHTPTRSWFPFWGHSSSNCYDTKDYPCKR